MKKNLCFSFVFMCTFFYPVHHLLQQKTETPQRQMRAECLQVKKYILLQ